jgi:hypothetical protein
MPTPSTRTPIRIARGTYSNLNASILDLQEGEICYATDQNTAYVVEGGALTPTVDPDTAKTDVAQVFTAPQRGQFTTLSINAGAVEIDFSATNFYYLDLTSNVSTVTFTNVTAGQSGSIVIEQDATNTLGGWPAAAKFRSGTAPTITATAGKFDRIDYICYDANNVQMVWTGDY